ncbi:hypothetical protein Gotur_030992 [Gossypium turneri]
MTFGHTLLSGSEKLLLREVFTSVQDSGSLPEYICTYVFVDLVPTVEEYMALLRCAKIQVDKVYSRAEFERSSSCTPGYEKEGRCLCLEHIRLGYLPQGLKTC